MLTVPVHKVREDDCQPHQSTDLDLVQIISATL